MQYTRRVMRGAGTRAHRTNDRAEAYPGGLLRSRRMHPGATEHCARMASRGPSRQAYNYNYFDTLSTNLSKQKQQLVRTTLLHQSKELENHKTSAVHRSDVTIPNQEIAHKNQTIRRNTRQQKAATSPSSTFYRRGKESKNLCNNLYFIDHNSLTCGARAAIYSSASAIHRQAPNTPPSHGIEAPPPFR